jgi:F-type H+-transporting ATPase subunit a
MHESELWLTKLFNQFLAGPANAVLDAVHMQHDAAKPWANYVVMEILVAVIVVVLFAMLRPKLSADNPGKLQHIFELIYNFLHQETEDQVGHHGMHYLTFFGTLFIFILFMNLIGVVTGFESPTI